MKREEGYRFEPHDNWLSLLASSLIAQSNKSVRFRRASARHLSSSIRARGLQSSGSPSVIYVRGATDCTACFSHVQITDVSIARRYWRRHVWGWASVEKGSGRCRRERMVYDGTAAPIAARAGHVAIYTAMMTVEGSRAREKPQRGPHLIAWACRSAPVPHVVSFGAAGSIPVAPTSCRGAGVFHQSSGALRLHRGLDIRRRRWRRWGCGYTTTSPLRPSDEHVVCSSLAGSDGWTVGQAGPFSDTGGACRQSLVQTRLLDDSSQTAQLMQPQGSGRLAALSSCAARPAALPSPSCLFACCCGSRPSQFDISGGRVAVAACHVCALPLPPPSMSIIRL